MLRWQWSRKRIEMVAAVRVLTSLAQSEQNEMSANVDNAPIIAQTVMLFNSVSVSSWTLANNAIRDRARL